jgi:hypothetical protein
MAVNASLGTEQRHSGSSFLKPRPFQSLGIIRLLQEDVIAACLFRYGQSPEYTPVSM